MRIAKSLAMALGMLASFPMMAQQVVAAAQESASGSVAGLYANTSAGAAAHANAGRGQTGATGTASAAGRGISTGGSMHASTADYARMRPVKAELEGKLDSKSAKVGERVVLKTTEKMKTADGVVIPRGSRLIGHVTEVRAHAKGHEEASLAIAFEQVELKHGESFAIHSMIEQVRPSAAALEANAMANEDTMAGPMGGGAGAMGGGGVGVGRAGGGMVSGATGAVGGAAASAGQTGASLDSTTGSALRAGGGAVSATGNMAGESAAGFGRGLEGSTSAVASTGIHATALPGVMLESSAEGGASGTFTAARKNIHFDTGTQMVVGVVAAR